MHFPLARFSIYGNSMEPFFKNGDRILVFRWSTVRAGDRVVFSKNGMTMVKCAVKKEGERWIMRGENFSKSTDSEDFGAVDQSEIIGKVLVKY